MALADLVAREKVVTVSGVEIRLRGLNFGDVVPIFMEHGKEINALISEAQIAGGDQEQMVSAAMNYLLGEANVLLAKIIARSCGEPDLWENALALSAPAQLDCLTAVFELTFTEPDSLGNFVRGLTALMGQVGRQAENLGSLQA